MRGRRQLRSGIGQGKQGERDGAGGERGGFRDRLLEGCELESIRLFSDASLDYNPLHLDDDYMKGSFGKTQFGGVIMHGMNNFGLIRRMLTDWAMPAGNEPVATGEAMVEFPLLAKAS